MDIVWFTCHKHGMLSSASLKWTTSAVKRSQQWLSMPHCNVLHCCMVPIPNTMAYHDCAFHHFITHVLDARCSLLHMPATVHTVSYSKVFRPQSETEHAAISMCYPESAAVHVGVPWNISKSSINAHTEPPMQMLILKCCGKKSASELTPSSSETMSLHINVVKAHYHALLLQLARRCLALIHCQDHQT